MAPEKVLFNATIVLIPIWLGVARYIIKETEFQSSDAANLIGLGLVTVLVGILYSMSVSVQVIASQSERIAVGFFGLLLTVGLTGFGGVLFIIREIEPISGNVVMGIPVGVVTIGLGVVFVPSVVSKLIPQIAGIATESSLDVFFSSLIATLMYSLSIIGMYIGLKRIRVIIYEYRAKKKMNE